MRYIDITHEYGSAEGYEINTSEVNARNYLAEYTELSDSIADWLKDNHETVALLKNINVDEECQGQGFGSELLSDFIDETDGIVLLIADKAESQREGFSLETWYEGFGFASVLETGAGQLMVMPEEVGLALKDHLELDSKLSPK